MKKLNARASQGAKVTKYKHTGYDFSGAPGQDMLVTDTLTKRFEKALQKQMFSGPAIFDIKGISGSFYDGLNNSSRKLETLERLETETKL